MAQVFTLNFTDGTAPATEIEFGSYTVAQSSVTGYSTATIIPATLTVDSTTASALPITLTADGQATVTITDSFDNPITTGVTFERYVSLSDLTGYTPVAGVIDITQAASGIYTINYLPYVDTTGINVYFKVSAPNATTTDFTIPMTQQTVTGLTLQLPTAVSVDSTLQDTMYTGFPLDGTVTGTPS